MSIVWQYVRQWVQYIRQLKQYVGQWEQYAKQWVQYVEWGVKYIRQWEWRRGALVLRVPGPPSSTAGSRLEERLTIFVPLCRWHLPAC